MKKGYFAKHQKLFPL